VEGNKFGSWRSDKILNISFLSPKVITPNICKTKGRRREGSVGESVGEECGERCVGERSVERGVGERCERVGREVGESVGVWERNLKSMKRSTCPRDYWQKCVLTFQLY
jgi:hypothetical protein